MVDYIDLATQFGGVLLLIVSGVLILAVVTGAALFVRKNMMYRRYRVMIFKRKRDEEGNEYPVFVGIDSAAIIKDRKLKKWVFHLRKNNIDLGEEEGDEKQDENRELDIPSIPSEKGGEVVFVEKLGPRKFAVGDPIWYDGTVKVKVSEADVAEALRTFDVNARFFSKDKSQLYAFIIYVVFAVLILVLIAYVIQKFDILVDVAAKLDSAAARLVETRAAAVVSGAPG